MAFRINKHMRIINKKYIISSFSSNTRQYKRHYVTKCKMAIKIHIKLRIIQEKYVIGFYLVTGFNKFRWFYSSNWGQKSKT